jgi:hypothetical protein
MRHFFFFCLLLAAVLLCSCQSALPPSGFLGATDSLMQKEKHLPFSRSWKNPGVDLASYSELVIRPMRTDGLRDLRGPLRIKREGADDKLKKNARQLALRGTEDLRLQLGRSPNRRVTVSREPVRREGVMLVETNLVEVDPGRPVVQGAAYVIPPAAALNSRAIGIEGRLVDAHSGRVLFAFSDLERTEVSLFDPESYCHYGVQNREMRHWADQLAQVIESNGSDLIRDSFPV